MVRKFIEQNRADGRKFCGGWNEGKQHGNGVYHDLDGVARAGLWEDGNLVEWYD